MLPAAEPAATPAAVGAVAVLAGLLLPAPLATAATWLPAVDEAAADAVWAGVVLGGAAAVCGAAATVEDGATDAGVAAFSAGAAAGGRALPPPFAAGVAPAAGAGAGSFASATAVDAGAAGLAGRSTTKFTSARDATSLLAAFNTSMRIVCVRCVSTLPASTSQRPPATTESAMNLSLT